MQIVVLFEVNGCARRAQSGKPERFPGYAEPPPIVGNANIAGYVTENKGEICAKEGRCVKLL